MSPRATIVLACHNVEEFIAEAFDSIVAQSCFQQLQVVPVDDGSTDSTRAIIQQYADAHPEQIEPIYFDHASGGPGRPRNAGLDVARADYVIFMDPDDRILGDGYTTLIAAAERYDSDLVIATRYGVPEHGGPEDRVFVDFETPDEIFNDSSYALRLDLLERRPVILKSAYRRSIIEEHGLRFIESISTSEDEIFDMKFILLCERITKIHDVVYLYTVARTGSVTSKVRLKVYEDLDTVFAGLDDALRPYFGQGITSYRLAGLLRTFYLPKLLLLDPDLTDDALELIYRACQEYGFDRLLQTENATDRRIIELIEARQFSQLMIFFMNQQLSYSARLLRARNEALAQIRQSLNRKSLRLPNALARQFGRAKRLMGRVRAGELAKILVALRKEGGFAQTSNGYWLFMDRRDKGTDNAEALYRYVRENGVHDKIAFVIRQDCPDYERLEADGFNLVPYDTLEHWEALYRADLFFTSHCDDVVIFPWKQYGRGIKRPLYRLVFLQHGIIRSDLSTWLGTKQFAMFCSSAPSEYNSLINNIRYRLTPDNLKLTGLARHDLLDGNADDYIIISPTWRSFLIDATTEEFRVSEFFRSWSGVLADQAIRDAIDASGLHIKLILHSSLNRFRSQFEKFEHVNVVSYDEVEDFASLVSNAVALVTDYSTISFDALYLNRPVIYYMFPESQQHEMNAGADLELYSRLGYRAESLDDMRSVVADLSRAEWKIDNERLDAINGFFAFRDRNNRQRIVQSALQIP